MRRVLQATYNHNALAAWTPILSAPLMVSVRSQSGFGRFRGGGMGRGRGNSQPNANANASVTRRAVLNQTGDGELSDNTRRMMRDDSVILASVIKHIPPNGAISVKSLNAQLSPDVQEALSEKYGGLSSFLQQRKQLFLLKTQPNDGVLYVASTPLAHQKLLTREKQRQTMQEMLGLHRPRRGGGFGRGRGGFSRGRGSGSYAHAGRGGRGRGGGGRGNGNVRGRGGGFGAEGRNFGAPQRGR